VGGQNIAITSTPMGLNINNSISITGNISSVGDISSIGNIAANNFFGTSSWAESASWAPAPASSADNRAIVLCTAFTPSATGADAGEIVVPYSTDGLTPVSWSVNRINFRVQTAGTLSSSVTIEKSIVSTAFSAVSLGTIQLSASLYETFTGSAETINSGDKIRFNVNDLGNAQNWTLITEISSL
jgi:hypothetical protein